MQSKLIDIVPKVLLITIDKYVAFTDFEFTDETLESLKYYHSVFNPTPDKKEIMKQFANCCETGELEVLKWLKKTYSDIVEKYFHELDSYDTYWGESVEFYNELDKYGICVTRLAHYNGHTNVVKWLIKTFNSSLDLDRGEFKSDLMLACASGILDLVKNIIEVGKLDIKDITYNNNDVFRIACMYKHYDIAEWLNERYKVIEKSDDIHALHKDVCNPFTFNQLPEWIEREINAAILINDHYHDYMFDLAHEY